MAARSLNKAQLIGNLTRDPELRYTPSGTAVCTFGMATNRSWVTDTGEKKEEAEFHRIVSWNKLAELCAQLLFKGRRVFVEGRLQTRQWTAQDGTQRQTTEIVISDMLILDSRRSPDEEAGELPEEPAEKKEELSAEKEPVAASAEKKEEKTNGKAESKPAAKKADVGQAGDQTKKATSGNKKKDSDSPEETEVKADDIPF